MAKGTSAAPRPTVSNGSGPRTNRFEPAIPHILSQKHRPRRQTQAEATQEQAQAAPSIPVAKVSLLGTGELSESSANLESAADKPVETSNVPSAVTEEQTQSQELNGAVGIKGQNSEGLENGLPVSHLEHSDVAVIANSLGIPALISGSTQSNYYEQTSAPLVEIPAPTFPPSVLNEETSQLSSDVAFLAEELHSTYQPSSSATSTPVPPVSQPNTNDEIGARRDLTNLIFGGNRDSVTSSPILPPSESAVQGSTPTAIQSVRLMPLHPLTQGAAAAPELNSSLVHNTDHGPPLRGLGYQDSLPGGIWPLREDPQILNSNVAQSRMSHQRGLRHYAVAERSEDTSFPPRFHPVHSRPHVYPQHDYNRPAMPYDHMRHAPPQFAHAYRIHDDSNGLPPVLMGAAAVPALEAESQLRRVSTRSVQQLPEDSGSMANYIHGQFGNREFSDYVIQLSHTHYLFPPTTLAAHGVILARSPKLRSLMRMQNSDQRAPQNHPKFLMVACSDRFLTHDFAFVKAVMRLYGEPLPDPDLIARLPHPPQHINHEGMRFALSYAAAGHFLQEDEIIMHALELATCFLTWETVATALAFSLEGGISPSFSAYEGASEDKASNSSSFDDAPAKLDSPTSAPTYGMYSDRMLQHIVKFLSQNCMSEFSFFSHAAQLPEIARLPAVAEPRRDSMISSQLSPVAAMSPAKSHVDRPGHQSRSDSRLSQIRFGDMAGPATESPVTPVPPAPVAIPDFPTTIMSSILLSVPFTVLRYLFESTSLSQRLGPSRTAEIARAVVVERERRRRQAVAHRAATGVSPQSIFEERLWRNTRYVEVVEMMHQGQLGAKFTRHVAGVETPRSGESQSSS